MSVPWTPDSRILTYGRHCCLKPHFHRWSLPRHEERDVKNDLQTFVESVNRTPAVQEPEWSGPPQPDAYGRQRCSHVHTSGAEPLLWSRMWRTVFVNTVSNTGAIFEQEWTMSPLAPHGRRRGKTNIITAEKVSSSGCEKRTAAKTSKFVLAA